ASYIARSRAAGSLGNPSVITATTSGFFESGIDKYSLITCSTGRSVRVFPDGLLLLNILETVSAVTFFSSLKSSENVSTVNPSLKQEAVCFVRLWVCAAHQSQRLTD